jgi:hypothetical protein
MKRNYAYLRCGASRYLETPESGFKPSPLSLTWIILLLEHWRSRMRTVCGFHSSPPRQNDLD